MHIDVVTEPGHLKVHWIEKLRDVVMSRSRDGGQGLSLIRDIVASRDGSLEFNWLDAGLIVAVEFKTHELAYLRSEPK